MTRTKEELIKLRSEYQIYGTEEETQKELIAIYRKEYKPKHTPAQYYKLIKDWDIDAVEERNAQDTNYPDMVYECFSIVSQWVYGITKEHCYDQIFEAVKHHNDPIPLPNPNDPMVIAEFKMQQHIDEELLKWGTSRMPAQSTDT